MRSKRRHPSSGYTLLEMMITVGIIAVLSAIAVPSYCKYTSKARQAEAKSSLTAIFTAERSFAVENGSYTACIYQIGVDLSQGQHYYAAGFNGDNISANTCGPGGGQACWDYNFQNLALFCTITNTPTAGPPPTYANAFDATIHGYFSSSTATGNNLGNFYQAVANGPAVPGNGAQVIGTGFVATAAGNVSTCSSPFDVWTIDNTGILTNVQQAL